MTVLQRKIKTFNESQQAEVLWFIEQLVDGEKDEKVLTLTPVQKAMIVQGMEDFKNGRIMTQE